MIVPSNVIVDSDIHLLLTFGNILLLLLLLKIVILAVAAAAVSAAASVAGYNIWP
jgi:hypothetical protein